MKKGLIAAIVVGVFAMIGIFTYVSINNTEIDLRNKTVAQQDVCKANFDKMHKVIAQVAQVPDHFMEQSKEAFKEIYPDLMEGRYSNDRGGALMSWVSEHNPNFDMSAAAPLYEKLQVAIEANRQEYFNEQEKLIDYQRAHKTFIQKIPNSWFVGSRGEVEITVITSAQTEATYESGQENDIELFD